jgi:hypothetical protein
MHFQGGSGLGRSGPAGLISKEKSNMDLIFEFQEISEFGKALEICTKRFRRNLDMGIFFLKSSILLKDF